MTLRAVIRTAAAVPLRALPAELRRRLIQVTISSLSAGDPPAAARRLLEVDDDLTSVLNAVATRYDGGVHVKHRLTRYHDFFVERIGAGERVVDIGCGIGALAYSVASRSAANVLGIDKDARSIAIAHDRYAHPGLEFVCGDALRDLPDRQFDTIIFSNVLEHLEDRTRFLKEAQRRLRPRRWLIRVPMADRDWRVPLRRELGMFAFNDPSHVIEYTTESFAAEMSAASLVIVDQAVNWGELWAEVRQS